MEGSLKTVSDRKLLGDLDDLVAKGRQNEADLLAYLAEVDQRELYLAQGCSSVAGGSGSSSPLARRFATGSGRRRRCSVTSFPTATWQRSSGERSRCWSRTRSGRGSRRRLVEGVRRLRGRAQPPPGTFRRTSSEPSVPATAVGARSSERTVVAAVRATSSSSTTWMPGPGRSGTRPTGSSCAVEDTTATRPCRTMGLRTWPASRVTTPRAANTMGRPE